MHQSQLYILLLGYILPANCITWRLDPNTHKCLKESVHQNESVIGEIEVSKVPGQKVDYIVRNSKGKVLAQKRHVSKDKFSLEAEAYDIIEICFLSNIPSHHIGLPQEISLTIKQGAEAKSYEAVKLKPIEIALSRLEDLSQDLVDDFALMRKKEQEMRDTNESTNSRLMLFSIISMVSLLGISTWQVMYLYRYFKAKKLIE